MTVPTAMEKTDTSGGDTEKVLIGVAPVDKDKCSRNSHLIDGHQSSVRAHYNMTRPEFRLLFSEG